MDGCPYVREVKGAALRDHRIPAHQIRDVDLCGRNRLCSDACQCPDAPQASFRALHGAAQAQMSSALMQQPITTHHLPPPMPRPQPAPRPQKRSRGSPAVHKPPAKAPRQSRPERPPPPTDEELKDLPAGLCRRYQQVCAA